MVRPPGVPTQITHPPTSSHANSGAGRPGRDGGSVTGTDEQLLAACGITDLDALAAHCQQLRHAAGKPTGRWNARQLLAVLDRAITTDRWPAAAAVPALLAVAADPATTSPMRLIAPGPRWDLAHRPVAAVLTADEKAELHQLTAQLEQLPDSGVGARYTARAQLTAEQQPHTRLTIGRRAIHLVDKHLETTS